MRVKTRHAIFRYLLMTAAFCVFVPSLLAQTETANKRNEFCSRGALFHNGSGATAFETRESVLPARNLLAVEVARHGSISVQGGDRSDILVRSCVQTWGISDEASRSLARKISIETNSVVRARSQGAADDEEKLWAVSTISYEIFVPRQTNLKLTTWNGNISISDVAGSLEFKALNDNLILKNPSGIVRGRTTNGGIFAALSGSGWMGGHFDVETANGSVELNIPRNYAANLEIGTGNGTFHTNVRDVRRAKGDQAAGLNSSLNGGGAPVRLMTVNGSVRLNGFGSSK